ncbi:MAG: hypothetical protein AAGB15_00175 [Pseudomonadota bacterium]
MRYEADILRDHMDQVPFLCHALATWAARQYSSPGAVADMAQKGLIT